MIKSTKDIITVDFNWSVLSPFYALHLIQNMFFFFMSPIPVNSGEFRCRKHWHTLGWLWCFCCSVMVFTCIPLPLDELYEQMAWNDGGEKRRGMHGNVNSHITLVRVDTVEQCFWCHPFDGETTLKGHRSVRTTAVLTRQDIQTPNEHQQACSLISYCPI